MWNSCYSAIQSGYLPTRYQKMEDKNKMYRTVIWAVLRGHVYEVRKKNTWAYTYSTGTWEMGAEVNVCT